MCVCGGGGGGGCADQPLRFIDDGCRDFQLSFAKGSHPKYVHFGVGHTSRFFSISTFYCMSVHNKVLSLSLSLTHARTYARTHARTHVRTHTHTTLTNKKRVSK